MAATRSLRQAVKGLDLRGVFVPLVTPFSSEGKIDYGKMEKNVFKFEKEVDLTGYIVGGSNSEVASLTPDERVDLVGRVRKIVAPTKMIIGGATSESTEGACDMAVRMASAGANGVLVLIPFYFKKMMTDEAITKHFFTLADVSPIPIVIYNNWMVSGIDISVPLLSCLAKHPNIRGVKDFDIRKMGVTVEATKDDNFDVLVGSAGCLLPALQVGCSGGMIALAGPLGPECCDVYKLAKEKKWDEAIKLQKRLIPVDFMISTRFGVPGLKAAMDLKGFECGHLRGPLVAVSEDNKREIRDGLIQSGFL